MRSFLIILWKEFIHIRRDKRTAIIVFLFPLLMVFLYGYAISFDLKKIPTGIVDFDKSTQAEEMLLSLSSSGYFDLRTFQSMDDMYEGIKNGEIKCGLLIPYNFSKMKYRIGFSRVQVIIDGSDSNLAKKILNNINRFFIRSSLNVRFLYNPEMKSRDFVVPGLIVIFMTILGAVLTARSIVGEKERGNYEMLCTTPVRTDMLILGKILPYGLIALFNVFLMTGSAILVFSIPFRGNIISLLLHSILFLFPTLAIGTMISTFATTELTALTGSFMSTMLPSIILSGFIFPVENMPGWLQWVSNIIPATHFLRIIRGIFLKGVNVFPEESLILLVLGILYLGITMLGASKRVK